MLSIIQTLTMQTLHSLRQFGLNDEESKVYLYLIKHTEATAFAIAKDTGIPRTTAYAKLESLKNQGLISSWKKNNVTYYTPESIKRLETILQEKQEILKQLLPELQSLSSSSGHDPVVKLFTGIDGMKIVLEDMIDTMSKEKSKILCATAAAGLIDYLPRYFPEWLKRREKLGIFTKLIMNESPRKEINEIFGSNAQRETRFLPANSPFKCTMDVYGNKVAFFSLESDKPYAVIIESPTISDMFRTFFLFTFEMLGRK